MAIPLNYQISEYDCGPVSLLNALNKLFDRKLIQPCVIKTIYGYTLDYCDAQRHPGQKGTSAAALRFIGEWLNHYGQQCNFPIKCVSLSPELICFEEGSALNIALSEGAVAVTRCMLDVGHYVLLTGIDGEDVLLWDPYHLEKKLRKKGIIQTDAYPHDYNRRVSFEVMNRTGKGAYSLGPWDKRECLLIWNTERLVQGGPTEPPEMAPERIGEENG